MQSFFHWGPDLYRPPLTHPTTRPPKASTSWSTRVSEGISRHPLSCKRVGVFMRAWVLDTSEAPVKIDFSRKLLVTTFVVARKFRNPHVFIEKEGNFSV